jgi:hypothetical protein
MVIMEREVEDESKHVLSESEQFRPFRLIPGRFGRSPTLEI